MKNKKGFTLVELLAVIVILAVILVIAIPQIIKTIEAARISSFKDSAILIATNAEKDYLSNKVLDVEYNATSIKCSDVAKLNEDYSVCSIKYDQEGNTVVKLKGRLNSKFEGLICEGSKDNMECIKKGPKRCKYEGNLAVGSEFVDGQYTYRYKQEYDVVYRTWRNISSNGWGVTLTDKNSTEPVTTELCTTINDKPITSLWETFQGAKATSIDVSSFDTSSVTTMWALFYNSSATEIIGLDSFDTSNVTNMKWVFFNTKPSKLDVSSFNTKNVTTMESMFEGSKATEIIGVENLNTSKVTTMRSMFSNTKVLNLNLNKYDTKNVTDMYYLFHGTKAININIGNFNTSKVVNMLGMFENTVVQNLDLSSFDTLKVTNMQSMFRNSIITILDLSNFNTTNVTNKSSMFSGAKATTVYVRNEEERERLSNDTEKPNTMNIVLKNN